MEVIELKDLTKEHLDKHWQILAVDGSREWARKVWDSCRLLPFVGRRVCRILCKRTVGRKLPSCPESQ